MAERSRIKSGRVLRTEQVAPRMIRVVLGGEGLAGFAVGPFTDSYVKLQFPQEDVVYPDPFDLTAIRETMPRDQWPRTRTYTVRRWDAEAGELWIDFVTHGDSGIAGPWAAKAQPGDVLHFAGPGGGYAPDPTADWHLLAGDESAWPAIAAALDALPAGAVARVFAEVDGPEDELDAPFDVVWLHRGDRPRGEALVAAVRALEFPPGRPHVFVHGEAAMVKQLRGHLRLERGVAREQLSISGYWRVGKDEDGWQAGKTEWNRQVEQEQENPA
ncbi:siderophore-interacting protein [Saccharothrix algeriensis]|uniref:NADPH-dependent ferric siderophore reductase n=1 Tax=Saccharothrix algeriensis TaxID=173560 RepID=A0A8T8HYQ5_9PSEU|nr:siderophore-interacting protein [Saccharothrix algeriensis]MBM7809209.1 NADPH-dependent ferric siderophore reductase [Saccharothrix algeriensis]QTR03568.1 siderophore-interacting protein [Saccharothrix algeriensis]